MADRKPFLLRIDTEVLDAVQRWANDDLRSLNGQIEFLLPPKYPAGREVRKILQARAETGRLDAMYHRLGCRFHRAPRRLVACARRRVICWKPPGWRNR